MFPIKKLFFKAVSLGIHSGLSEEKKLALRVATVDGYWTLIALSFYFFYSLSYELYPMALIHGTGVSLTLVGLFLMSRQKFDAGRILMYLVGVTVVFLNTDAAGSNSGYEFYYFTNIALPFVAFAYEEQWKGNALCTLTCIILISQQLLGTGFFMEPIVTPPEDKIIAVLFVMTYVLTVFIFGRIQIRNVMKVIEGQQDELIHSSKLMALGEMASGIAHEINNPVQALSLNLSVIKEKFPNEEFLEHYQVNDALIRKIGKMVQGLKDISRNDFQDTKEDFDFSKILEDVLTISNDRLKKNEIQLIISGDPHHAIAGKAVQISQVLINLLNNSIDAVLELEERWIRIDVQVKSTFLQIAVIDSGKGIPPQHVDKILQPFYTTKEAKKGTGLGLSISVSIVEKNQGRLYYEAGGKNTKFVILLPLALNQPVYRD